MFGSFQNLKKDLIRSQERCHLRSDWAALRLTTANQIEIKNKPCETGLLLFAFRGTLLPGEMPVSLDHGLRGVLI